MILSSFNVAGIRARLHQLKTLAERHDPQVIGIQEVKARDEDFPWDAVAELGYHVATFGQKGHYGVALLSRHQPVEVQRGFFTDAEDAQRRFISASFDTAAGPVTVMNGYFPQGASRDHPTKFPGKQKFYADLLAHLGQHHRNNENLVLMGDFNVSFQDSDIGIGEENRKRWLRTGKCSFLPEEREWLQCIEDWGFVDPWRALHPHEDNMFSWFDYRSRGFERDPKRGLRIDHIWVTPPLFERVRGAGISYDIRAMEKPSDHCPIWLELAS